LTRYIKTEINAQPVLEQRRLFFISSSDGDLNDLPVEVKEEFLNGLTIARLGGTPPNMKPWKGEGPGVYELVKDYRGDTYRAVYMVRFKEAMYVLHVFNKKSKTGSKTPQPDVKKIGARLKKAEGHYEENFKAKKRG
jgi:phage-related protein